MAESRAEVGRGVWRVCREGLLKEEDKLQVSLGGTGGVCQVRQECGRRCRQKKSKCKSMKVGSSKVRRTNPNADELQAAGGKKAGR